MALAGLSDGFVYAPKPPAAPAANIRVTVPTANKDVFSVDNDTMMFNIPSGKRGQYLNTRMSYLKFDLTVDADFTHEAGNKIPILQLDGGAHALFNNLEVFHGSNLLEQIREYSALYQLMSDTGENMDGNMSGRSVAEGFSPNYTVSEANFSVTPVINNCLYRNGATVSPVALPHAPTELRIDDFASTGNTHKGYGYSGLYTHAIDLEGAHTPTWNENQGLVKYNDSPELCRLNQIRAAQAGTIYAAKNKSSQTFTFCIPLISGVVGAQMSKYLPVGALASDLRLELGLNVFANAFKTIGVIVQKSGTLAAEYSTLPKDIWDSSDFFNKYSFKISRAELQLEYIEVASDVQQAIEAATGGQYVVSFDSFYDFQTSLPANNASVTQLIGAKFSSIKTVYSIFRDQHMFGKCAFPVVTSRVNPFSTKNNRPRYDYTGCAFYDTKYNSGVGWQYQIGATQYPPRPVQSDEESYMEGIKAQHSVAAQQRNGSITRRNWTTSARRDLGVESEIPSRWYQMCAPGGTFFCAQNLESQSHKSHLAESGVNTLAQSMYLHATFPSASTINGMKVVNTSTPSRFLDGAFGPEDITSGITSATDPTPVSKTWQQCNQALRVDHYIHYDAILIVSNGICSTRF